MQTTHLLVLDTACPISIHIQCNPPTELIIPTGRITYDCDVPSSSRKEPHALTLRDTNDLRATRLGEARNRFLEQWCGDAG